MVKLSGGPAKSAESAEAEIRTRIVPGNALVSDAVVDATAATAEPAGFPNVLADGWPTYLRRSISTLFLQDKLNLLMLVTPLALCARRIGLSDSLTFLFALIAIAPFAERLSFVTEQLAMYTNDTLGALINATFGNVTELIVSVVALHAGMYHIVQANLLGSVLSNLLLVLGMALFFGGLKNETQTFNRNAASMNSSLLMLAAMAMLFPTMLALSGAALHASSVLLLSRVMSALLVAVYAAFLFFQLATHRHLFEGAADEEDKEDHEFVLGLYGALVWLGLITAVIALLSEAMVDAIEGAAASWGVPEVFIGVIVIPIVGNAAEHAAAIIFALKNKMDLALGIAVGSATQIALSVIPALVLLGWAMGRPLDLEFEAYEAAAMFSSCVLVSVILAQGQTNWLQGVVLVAAYVLIAAGFLVHA